MLEAAQALGLLHQRMDWGEILGDGAWTKEKMQEMIPQASDHEPVLEIELKPFAGRDMLSELRRHNRELKKVRAFIRSRVTKNEFERRFLAHFERMYEMAQSVTVRRTIFSPGWKLPAAESFLKRAYQKGASYTEIIIITTSGSVPAGLQSPILSISEWMYRYRICIISCER